MPEHRASLRTHSTTVTFRASVGSCQIEHTLVATNPTLGARQTRRDIRGTIYSRIRAWGAQPTRHRVRQRPICPRFTNFRFVGAVALTRITSRTHHTRMGCRECGVGPREARRRCHRTFDVGERPERCLYWVGRARRTVVPSITRLRTDCCGRTFPTKRAFRASLRRRDASGFHGYPGRRQVVRDAAQTERAGRTGLGSVRCRVRRV